MPSVPTPFKVVLGIAATAAEEARKLPETLPTAMAGAPMIAVSTAMQASLRVQQHIAALAARGEEVLAQLRGTSDEPPAWATFDDPKPDDLAAGRVSDKAAGKSASAGSDTPLRAAFDRIDYEGTGYAEADEHHDRWDAVGAGSAEEPAGASEGASLARKAAAKKAPTKRRAAKPAAPGTRTAKVAAVRSAQINAAAERADAEAAAPARKVTAHKTSASKTSASKAQASKAPAKKAAANRALATKAPATKAPATKASAKRTSLAEDLASAARDATDE
ncbi:MAG: hypothetical protein QOH56_868 [Pseudonocardiales bacterium]|nr:hypothetical protein [Pseudonocardiales bacterium]